MKGNALSKLGRRTAEPPITWLMREALVRPGLISLAAGFTDNPSLPVVETREIMVDMLRTGKTGQPPLQYGTTAGDETLRKLTSRRLATLDGQPAKARAYQPNRMVITHGSQQLLYILTEILFDPGDIVLVEDPSYFVFLGIMQSHGLRARSIRMEADGIDLAHLEATLESLKQSGELPQLKALYLVSYHSNPTGTTTTAAKKAGALKLLRRYESHAGHPIYLLEDAAYRELRFSGEDTPSALTMDRAANRVIYTSTYSKPFATGVRIGYGLLPDRLLTAALRVKGNHDFGTTNFLQQLISRAVSNGAYEKHVQVLRKRYAKKAAAMLRACSEYLPSGVQWTEPNGGLYVWARMPAGVKTDLKSKLFAAALQQKMIYVPGNLCYADDPSRRKPNREMRLSFGSESIKNIEEGIYRLGRALKKLSNKKRRPFRRRR
jgi:2-aminoadipate transaminase|tara:strand:+ start:3535 stop:4839 length:1305 start_codon:yes stop_codon:yes gene_type:complete